MSTEETNTATLAEPTTTKPAPTEKFYTRSGGQLNTRSGNVAPGANILKDDKEGELDLTLLRRNDGKGGENPLMVTGGTVSPNIQTGQEINIINADSPKSRGTDWIVLGRFVNTKESLLELEKLAKKNVIRYAVID